MHELRTRAIRGVGWSAAQRWVVRATSLVTFVALSRVLTPAELGTAALALAVVSAFQVFVDLGMSDFLIRAEREDDQTSSTVFWVQVSLGMVLAVPVVLLAHAFSTVVGAPELAPVLQVLTLLLPLNGAAAVPTALLKRHLSFSALAVRDIAAALLSGALGVTLALLGAGVWALVAQACANAGIALVAVLTVSHWRPRLILSTSIARHAVRFGGPLMGVQVMQIVRDRADAFIIGGLAGPAALGIWTVAARLLSVMSEVTSSVIDAVALPVFAQIHADPHRLGRVHRTSVAYCVSLLTPAVVTLAVASPFLVPLLFGTQWRNAVPLAQVLCVAYAVWGLAYLNRATLVASGRVAIEFVLTAVAAVLHVGVVVLAIGGGLTAVAWAAVGESVVAVALGGFALRMTVLPVSAISASALKVLVAGGLAAGCGLGLTRAASVEGWAVVWASTGTALAVWALLMALTNRALIRDMVSDARRLLPARVPQ